MKDKIVKYIGNAIEASGKWFDEAKDEREKSLAQTAMWSYIDVLDYVLGLENEEA